MSLPLSALEKLQDKCANTLTLKMEPDHYNFKYCYYDAIETY